MNDQFRDWRNDPASQVLCVTDHAGDKHPMLLSSMIDSVESDDFKGAGAAYFFLRAHVHYSVAAVLRGLMFMMTERHWPLIKYVKRGYDRIGQDLFDKEKWWDTLLDIFKDMLDDPLTSGTVFFVGAIDRCTHKDELLHWIVQFARITRTKWIISTNQWLDLQKRLPYMAKGTRLSIEFSAGPSGLQLWYASMTRSDKTA